MLRMQPLLQDVQVVQMLDLLLDYIVPYVDSTYRPLYLVAYFHLVD